jgi:hypothetical protein
MVTKLADQRQIDTAKAVVAQKQSVLEAAWAEFDLAKEDFATKKGQEFYERIRAAKAERLLACRDLAAVEEATKLELP